jgi:glycine cleavage system pyridoxal-binding protein P
MSSFARRHIGPSAAEAEEMLKAIGASSLDKLTDEVVPSNIRNNKGLNLSAPMTEPEYLSHIRELSKKNKVNNPVALAFIYSMVLSIGIIVGIVTHIFGI